MKDMCAALAVMFTLLDSNSIFVQQVDGNEITLSSTQSFPFLHYTALLFFSFLRLFNNLWKPLEIISEVSPNNPQNSQRILWNV